MKIGYGLSGYHAAAKKIIVVVIPVVAGVREVVFPVVSGESVSAVSSDSVIGAGSPV